MEAKNATTVSSPLNLSNSDASLILTSTPGPMSRAVAVLVGDTSFEQEQDSELIQLKTATEDDQLNSSNRTIELSSGSCSTLSLYSPSRAVTPPATAPGPIIQIIAPEQAPAPKPLPVSLLLFLNRSFLK